MSILLFACIDFPNGPATTAHCTLMVKGIRKNEASAFLLIPFGTSNSKELNNKINKGHYLGVPFFFMNEKAILPNRYRWKSILNGMFRSAFLLYKRWEKNKKDIVILYSPNLIKHFPIICICLVLRIPLFPWAVEKESSNKDFKGIKVKFNRCIEYCTEKILPKIATGLIVISSYLKDYYSKYIPEEKIIISPILVNPNNNPKLDKYKIDNFRKKYIDKKIIVYSGNFDGKDGFSYILQAMKKFIKIFPDSILVTTGKPSKYYSFDYIDNLADEMELKENFEYLGLVSRDELKIIQKAADLLLVCRSNSIYANYGFPWKLGEYCMTARPIIATKVGDIEKYFKEKEDIFLAAPEDSNSIFLQMENVFNEYQKALEISKNGYERACIIFNYQTETKKILDFIK